MLHSLVLYKLISQIHSFTLDLSQKAEKRYKFTFLKNILQYLNMYKYVI